ncbi:MAG: hypothetical protein ACI4TB_03545 [Lachnospiraceae bacterium]
MKLKYYLRGLGIGILVTAIIMGIAAGKKEQMTDEEIKARARELGMVESMVLSDIATTPPVENTEPEETPEPTVAPVLEETPQSTENQTVTDTPEPETTPEQVITPEPETTPEQVIAPEPEITPEPEEIASVTITIKSGQSSVAVSKLLAEAGLVESASEFDKYLCSNGYDKKIRTGTYEIPTGADEEEIARIITGGSVEN